MENKNLVSINLLTYNAQKYIYQCLNGIFSQTYPFCQVLIIDNNSHDETVNLIKSYFKKHQVKFNTKLFINPKNFGFATAHNQAIIKSKGEFVLCLNQDVVLDKNFVIRAVEALKKNQRIGAVQGKLLKYNFKQNKIIKHNQLPVIDTTGLVMLKNRRVVNRGQGQADYGQYNSSEEIFGVDGAAPLFRRKALEDIKIPLLTNLNNSKYTAYEYFDEDFFIYKEDVDLAWRLKLYGWKSIYQPKAVALHERSAGENVNTSYLKIIQERRKVKRYAKFFSFRNQRLMQIKNELWPLLLKNLPTILLKEIGSWIYVLIFEHNAWQILKDLIKLSPKMCKKRKIIMKNKQLNSQMMAKWFK